MGIDGYRAMLVNDCRLIPDLAFQIEMLVCDQATVASRLCFRCHPAGEFLGLPVNGRWVDLCENVFYAYRDGRIARVLSIVDRSAISQQLPAT